LLDNDVAAEQSNNIALYLKVGKVIAMEQLFILQPVEQNARK
jgi:hypothetical protein